MDQETAIIPLDLAEGKRIYVEATRFTAVSPKADSDEQDVAYSRGIGEEDVAFLPDFQSVTDAIEGIATAIRNSLEKVKPEKATIEFGVEFGVESGKLTALIVKGSGKANLKISLQWGS